MRNSFSLKGQSTMHHVENNVYPSGDTGAGVNPVEKLRRDAMRLRKENALFEESNLKLEEEKKVLERRLRRATVCSVKGQNFERKHEIVQNLIKVGDEHFFVVDEYKTEFAEKLSVEKIGCGSDKLLVKKEEYSEKKPQFEKKFP